MALDDFLKQKLAFVDKIQAQLTCFQQSDVKTNYQTRSGILKHCAILVSDVAVSNSALKSLPLFLTTYFSRVSKKFSICIDLGIATLGILGALVILGTLVKVCIF